MVLSSVGVGGPPVATAGRGWVRVCVRLVGVLLLCNVVFLGVRLAGAMLPKGPIAAQVQRGLALGVFSADDYPGNYLIGFDQWTDCLAFELALTPSRPLLEQALAPRVLSDTDVERRCPAVVDYVEGKYASTEIYRYTRFWHGYASVAAAALQVMPLRAYRGLLVMLCYGGVAFAALCAAGSGRRAGVMLLPLFAGVFAFSEIDQLGALVSQGPAFVTIWLFAGALFWWRARIGVGSLLAIVVAMGASEAFLDSMILCPLSAAVAVIAAGCGREERLSWGAAAGLYAMVLAAWCFGFLGTYVCKLVLTMALLGVGAVLTPFLDQLRLRMALGGQQAPAYPGRLFANMWRMTYADDFPRLGAVAAIGVGCVGWACALLRLARGRAAVADGMGLIGASVVVLAWYTVFREHTSVHAFFMVRETIVWITAGWCWFLAIGPTRRAAGRGSLPASS